MEKLQPSEDEIIKLGKKLVSELALADGVDTLSKWMAHYLAELLHGVENAQSDTEKASKQKECCEVILRIWEKRESIPHINTPIRDLQPLLGVLQALEPKDPSYFLRQDKQAKASWQSFVDVLKGNSQHIIEVCIYASMGEELLAKSVEWLREYKDSLSEEELTFLKYIDIMVNKNKSLSFIIDKVNQGTDLSSLPAKERYEAIFNSFESRLDESKEALLDLKEEIMKDLKSNQ